MKTSPTEKTEYTTTIATKNTKKLQSQIFYFQNFVTEIFPFKVSHFSFFQKFQKTQILTILAAKLRALPEHLNQSQQVENDPRYMCFKVDFINFFRRSLRFGAILSDRFNHILIGANIDIFDENCENGRFCFSHISMKTESPIKVWGSKTFLSDRPRRWVGKQTKKIISKGQILLCKITLFQQFFQFLGRFCHLLAIFGPFLGRYKVCWLDPRLPTTKWVKLQYIFCVSLSFLAIFFVIFGKILGFLSLFYCILCHFVYNFRYIFWNSRWGFTSGSNWCIIFMI